MKKLIIVCDDKLKNYGDFLAQLISQSSTSTEKDNGVAAQVWTEKQYRDNESQISSEQYILFIGDSKLLREKRAFTKIIFSKFGMNYGWLGKQASLFVDRKVTFEEYEDFYGFAKSKFLSNGNDQLIKLVETNEKDNKSEPSNNSKGAFPQLSDKIKDNATVKLLEESFNNTVEGLIIKQDVGFIKEHINIKKFDNGKKKAIFLKNGKELLKQEYSCLVLLFYSEALCNFLNISEG